MKKVDDIDERYIEVRDQFHVGGGRALEVFLQSLLPDHRVGPRGGFVTGLCGGGSCPVSRFHSAGTWGLPWDYLGTTCFLPGPEGLMLTTPSVHIRYLDLGGAKLLHE